MYKPLTEEQYNQAIQAGFSHQEIIQMEKERKLKNAPQPKNYFQRVGESFLKAGENVVSGIKKSALQVAGGISDIQNDRVLKGVGGIAGGLGRAAARTVGQVAQSAFTPVVEAPIIKPALEKIGTGISKIPGVEDIVKKATELSDKYPEYAKDFQNIIDVVALGVGSGVQKTTGTALEKTGVAIEKSGIEALGSAKKSFAEELVSPIKTSKVKLEQVPRTIESGSFFKKDTVIPTKLESQAAEEVSKVVGISPKNTFQKNYNLVREYNIKQAKQLESDIAQYDFAIPKEDVLSKLNKAAEELSSNPLIVGDAEKTANRLIEGAKKFIDKNSGSGSGMLKARKEYDAWVLSQKSKAFDASSENAFTIANRTVRDTLNTILDENATNLGIKDSLRRQSSLYRAMENIAPKAAQEANTPLLRAFDRAGKVLGVKSRLVQAVATAVGIGGLGAAATFAPAVATLGGIGFLTYKAGKLIMKPEVRIAIGKLLQQSGHLLNPTDRKLFQNAINFYKE